MKGSRALKRSASKKYLDQASDNLWLRRHGSIQVFTLFPSNNQGNCLNHPSITWNHLDALWSRCGNFFSSGDLQKKWTTPCSLFCQLVKRWLRIRDSWQHRRSIRHNLQDLPGPGSLVVLWVWIPGRVLWQGMPGVSSITWTFFLWTFRWRSNIRDMLGFWLTRDAGAEPKKCGLVMGVRISCLYSIPHILKSVFTHKNNIYVLVENIIIITILLVVI